MWRVVGGLLERWGESVSYVARRKGYYLFIEGWKVGLAGLGGRPTEENKGDVHRRGGLTGMQKPPSLLSLFPS